MAGRGAADDGRAPRAGAAPGAPGTVSALNTLRTAYAVDAAIMHERERLVVVRFGRPAAEACMLMDGLLLRVAARIRRMAIVYAVDTDEVPAFNDMYELSDPCSLMFFYRNRFLTCDYRTGEARKITFPIYVDDELIDIVRAMYYGAIRGRREVVAPHTYAQYARR